MRFFVLLGIAAVLSSSAVAADSDEPDVAAMIKQYEEDAETIRKKADLDLRQLRERLIERLSARQEKLMKEGNLPEAVLIRDQITALTEQQKPIKVQAYPGSMSGYRDQIGATFYFEVTGAIGTCYGTDVYTDDSSLQAAAVHAGALRSGESGVLRVTVVPGQSNWPSSARNGVTSTAWQSSWPAGFRVQRVHIAGKSEAAAPAAASPPK